MTRQQLLKEIYRQSGVKPQLLRDQGDHLVYLLEGWTKGRPGAAENTQKGMFTLSLTGKKLQRAKIEAVLRDLGLRSPWHR